MNKIKAILVDDEEGARDVLENLLKRFCPDVELLDKCENVLQAVESIKIHKPDLVFLDIEMPNYSGFEIVKFFTDIDFELIFVTAYDQYAIRAFEVAAIDYLLKPVDIERLKLAVERVKQRKDNNFQNQQLQVLGNTLQDKKLKNIVISDKGQQNIVALDDIVAIEAQESYCTIYTADKNYLASKNLRHFESLLENSNQFFRVHKSWLINLQHIKFYSKSDLSIQMKNGLLTKLSKYKKAEFEEVVSA